MNKEERGIEIDLFLLIRKMIENIKYIIMATVILGVVGFAVSALFMTPIYQANAKMIVNTRRDDTQHVTNDQLNSAKNLVDTYAVIIRSRDVLNQVINDLNLTESYGQLVNGITVKSVNGTQVMQISVQHSNRDIALKVTEKILEIAPSVIVETVEAGSVKAVEQAYASSEPVSPNILKNAVITAMLGFVLSCAVIVVVVLLDNTYKSNIDVQRDLDLPVLGVIPTVESCSGYAGRRKSAIGRE